MQDREVVVADLARKITGMTGDRVEIKTLVEGGAGGNNQSAGDNAGRGNKRKAEGNQRETNATIEGCIVNRTGRNINFPSSLSQKYYSHFADIDKLCTFKERCKLSHASFPDGYAAHDVSPMINFVKKTLGLGWHNTIKVPFQ